MLNRLGLGSASQDFLRVSKHSSNYFIGQILTKSLGFLLIPLYTRFLVPADYGILAMVNSLSSVLAIFCTLGQRDTFARFYWDYKDNRQELGELFSTVLVFVGSISFFLTLGFLLFGKRVLGVLLRGIPFNPYIKLGLLLSFFSIFPMFWLTLCRNRERSLTYVIATTMSFLLTTALSIYFVVFLRQGALGRLKGQLYVQIAFTVLSLILLGRESLPRVSVRKLVAGLKYGLPLLPGNLSAWIISLLDRVILGGYHGLSSVGVYNVGYAFGGAMGMVATAFNFAYSPYFMKKLTEQGDAAKTTISRVATLWTAAMVFIAVGISAFSWEVVHLMTPSAYHDAWKVVPIITLAFLFQGMYFMSVAPLFYNKKFTRYVPIGIIAGGTVNTLGNFLLIPRYDMMGAAWATALSYFVMFVITHLLSKRAYLIPYEYGKIGKILAIGVVVFALTFTISQLRIAWWERGALKLLAITFYFLLLVICRIFDWKRIRQLIVSIITREG